MGKKKQFDKQRSITFKLVPAVDKNGQSRIMFQAVVPKKSKLTEKQKQQIIKDFSNEHEFEIKEETEHDDRFAGIPPEILEKIRGRSDLVINGRPVKGKGKQVELDEEDFGEDVDEDKVMENIDEYDEFYVEEGEDEDYDEEQEMELAKKREKFEKEIDDQEGEEDEEWETDSEQGQQQPEEQQITKEQQVRETKPNFQNFEQDFPQLPEPGTSLPIVEQSQLSNLTSQQLQILNNILPKNYKEMKISNAQTIMFDQDGNPIDGYDYSQHFSKFKGEAVAKFEVEFIVPTEPDIDIVEEKLPAGGREVDEALEKAEIYEELQDDFFIKLMQSENVKVQEGKSGKQSKNLMSGKPAVKKETTKTKQVAKQKQQIKEPEFTEDELIKMMNQMRNNTKKQSKLPEQNGDGDDEDYQDIDDEDLEYQQHQQDNVAQQQEQDERQFHQLNKKQRRIFMKNYKIPEVQDLAKQQLKLKMKIFKGVKPEEIHLKTIHPKIPFSQDIAMQNTLNKGSDVSDISSMSQASDHDDDIVSYHTKHSTVSSSVNFITEAGDKKKEKKARKENDENNEGDESKTKSKENQTQLRKPEQPISEKRDRNQTAEEKKLRKQQLKDFKKDKRESKKQFMEELKIQKKIVQNNSKAAMHGVSHINYL